MHAGVRSLRQVAVGMQDIVEEMAEEKAAHIQYLRNVLGDDAPPCPAMDIGPAFAAAADAAEGRTLTPTFDPYLSDTLFLHGAFLLQDVFASAYAGGTLGAGAGVPPLHLPLSCTFFPLFLGSLWLEADGVELPQVQAVGPS